MVDARCLLCDKNSTEIGYSKFGPYPDSCAMPEAQAYIGEVLKGGPLCGELMISHVVDAHGFDRLILEQSTMDGRGNFVTADGLAWLNIVNLPF